MIKVIADSYTTSEDQLVFYIQGLSFVKTDTSKCYLMADFVISYREAVRLNHFLDKNELDLGCDVTVLFEDAKDDQDTCFVQFSTTIEEGWDEDTLPDFTFDKEVKDYREEIKEVFGIELASEESIERLKNREKYDISLISKYNDLMIFKELYVSKEMMQEFMYFCADNCVYPKVEKAGNRWYLTI